MSSPYEPLGGQAAIDTAVDSFYRKVLTDSHISRFFGNVYMAGQAAKQKSFLTMVTGGPNGYTGKDMRSAHARLVAMGLDDSHFDRVVKHLGDTLKELGVADGLIADVAGVAESTRADVLGQ